MGYSIKEGDIVEAIITSIKDFGAFADFGEGSGLIYFTQIVPKTEHGNVSSVLSLGQRIKCKVDQIKSDGKISLSMRISATVEKKQSRKQIIENVKEDIKEMDSDDTSIRSIWKNLTDIQYYMLMYMQGNIPLKKGSAKIDTKNNSLIAEIDTSLHFENFKKEVRRIFDADVHKHPSLSNYWYFETDVELHSQQERAYFSEACGHMYVIMGENPVIEIVIKADNDESNRIVIERLQTYYPQMDILSNSNNELYMTLPYQNRSDLNDLKIELTYALSGIRNGIQDESEDSKEQAKQYDAANFNYEILSIIDGQDKFLITQNPEALMDEEGLRFGTFKGQNFIIPNGDRNIQIGILNKIDYPQISFRLKEDSLNELCKIIAKGETLIVTPDTDDMTGEIE